MRDAGVANQEIQISLAHGYPAAMNDVTQAKPSQHVEPVMRAVRHERQCDPNQAIETEFLQHARMQHRGSSRRRAIPQRRPGVKWPERNEDAEAKHQQAKNRMLRSEAHLVSFEIIGDSNDIER